ncbi:MAG: helix-turn-helix domain-containing protein [Oscillospiraceae bacterium]|jgi:transcriptional regulator with XRE-family HTH domain|nr:helix-turn-helix domain-containing protein [Oscillospiraceae bacterium]
MYEISFGKYLESLRNEKGLSQRALALRTDLTNSTVSRIEADLVAPDPRTLVKLAAALGVDKETLMIKCGYSDMPPEFVSLARKSEGISPEAKNALFKILDEAVEIYLKERKD